MSTYDKRIREYLTPVKIIKKSSGVIGEENLLLDKSSVIVLSDEKLCTMKKGDFVLLDFGREISGSLRISTGYIDGVFGKTADLHIRFGESVSEAMSTLGEDGACNDHVPRDIRLSVPFFGTIEYGESGFRFVWIELLDDVELNLQCIKAVCIHDDVKQIGHFVCDDEQLNQIWQTGVYTVNLTMQNYIVDGVKRDRLVWLGDMQPETDTIACAFGNAESIERSLDLGRDSAFPPNWINGIPTYSMWWIIIQYDYYIQNGKLDYLMKQREYFEELIPHAVHWITHFKDDCEEMKSFVDWSAKDSIYEEAGVKAVFIMAFEAAEKICEIYNNYSLKNLCKDTIKLLRNEELSYEGNKQVAALTVLADMTDAKKVFDEILSVELLDGLSTFMGYYVLQALAKAERYDEAVKIIREYWGAMLALGATTFWEDFDIRWIENAGRIDEIVPEGKHDIHKEYGKHCYKQFRHSLCHGWASGPTPFMTRYLLGVKALEPGCKKIEIEPHMCGLKWIKGDYPTPYGLVRIEHSYDGNGKLKTDVKAPEEVEIILH